MTEKKLYASSLWLCIFVLTIDILSKWMTQEYLPLLEYSPSQYPYGGIAIFENILGIEFSITHHTNTGAAWGIFADYPLMLLFIRVVLITGMMGYLLLKEKSRYFYALSLIITGATGNIIDFFLYGHVIDMFYFVFWGYNYPVFNVADSLISIGILLYFLLSFTEKKVVENEY